MIEGRRWMRLMLVAKVEWFARTTAFRYPRLKIESSKSTSSSAGKCLDGKQGDWVSLMMIAACQRILT